MHIGNNTPSNAMAGFDEKFTGAGGADSGAVLDKNIRQTGGEEE